MNSFYTGQVVVCINERESGYWKSHRPDGSIMQVPGPKMNDTCVIRGFDCTGNGLLLDLYATKVKYINGTEAGYHYTGFRPLVAYKNDISIFKALLAPARHLPVPHTSQP